MLEKLNEQCGDIDDLLGLARNPVLHREGEAVMAAANEQYATGHPYVRHFGAFSYAAESWPHQRHVVMKAEVGAKGENPRFVVTSLQGVPPELLYDAYCERGQCENYIKDLKVAAHVTRSARRLWVRLPTSFPLAAVFMALADSLSWAPS